MDAIAKSDYRQREWDGVMAKLRHEMALRQVHPSRTVVLLPYVQLIGIARGAWLRTAGSDAGGAHFMPRFDSTMNWSRSLAGFAPGGDDLVRDAARDLLTADTLLDRTGWRSRPSALGEQLMQAALSLASVASAVPPGQRADWGQGMAQALQSQGGTPLLEWESRVGRTALAWAAHSAYPTDALFLAQADLLVVISGLLEEPLIAALQRQWGERTIVLPLAAPSVKGALALHQALDAQDEADLAAACVLAHLAAGRQPLALVAQDRVLTRRVRALLGEQDIRVRDETGWTLSTTRPAAAVVGLLRALAPGASTDSVLDWAKQTPALAPAAVDQLESDARRAGMRVWRAMAADDATSIFIETMRAQMQATRVLSAWLRSLRGSLQESGQWTVLLQDAAGQAVLDALHLQEHSDDDLQDASGPMSLVQFAAWVTQVLEAGSFLPPHPEQEQEQVVILPLSQLLGRPMAAVVIPGCDEDNLSPSPDLPGLWTPAQRATLGLPSREQVAVGVEAAWNIALGTPFVDILWRASDGGEPRMPSILVQRLRLGQPQLAADPRPIRVLQPHAGAMPQPAAPALTPDRLSASAYEDLRRCPYRFFALRMLGLQESDELDAELGKREFGNWLHLVLRHFHEALASAPVDVNPGREAMLDQAAERATLALGLAASDFLPFAASWPQLRAAYLSWLSGHEAHGMQFHGAEVRKEIRLGDLTLHGRIDRIDRMADGGTLVIDYKTEPRSRTQERIRGGQEDTQLAFYGALLDDDRFSAMYLNIAESDSTKAYPMDRIVDLRDQLVQAILREVAAIAGGAALPALGAGTACDYCAARGLCRKDFWSADEATGLESSYD